LPHSLFFDPSALNYFFFFATFFAGFFAFLVAILVTSFIGLMVSDSGSGMSHLRPERQVYCVECRNIFRAIRICLSVF
jgi:hypothetical protein